MQDRAPFRSDVVANLSSDPEILRASATSFCIALERSPTPTGVFTIHGETVLLNEAFVHATGFTTIDLPDIRACLTKMRRVRDDDIEALVQNWLVVQSGPSLKEISVWTVQGDLLIWRVQTSDPVLWPDGRRVVVQSMFDLTLQKKLEDDLRRNQGEIRIQLAEVESLYSSAPFGLGVIDRDMKFVSVNKALAEIK
jgi:PAS domain-containing protein